jgi:hypothetical protein
MAQIGYAVVVSLDSCAFTVSLLIAMGGNYRTVLHTTALTRSLFSQLQ